MLLDLDFSKEVFFDYWDIRVELFKVARVEYSFKTTLSDIMIQRSQIQPLAEYIGKGVWKALRPWIKEKEAELKKFR